MTRYEEALKYYQKQYSDLCDGDLAEIGEECKKTSFIAIECIKKQIQQKAISGYKNWQGVNVGYECPACSAKVEYEDGCGGYAGRMIYCDNCGQKIDWRNENAE